MSLIDRIRQIASQAQANYIAVLTGIKVAHEARLKAIETFEAMSGRTSYSFGEWRRAPINKIYDACRAEMTDCINRLLRSEGAGFEIISDEIAELELPEYRHSAISCLDKFHVIEIEAALQADLSKAVEAIIGKFAPEAIAERARREALEAVTSALGIGNRWTVIRQAKNGMVFELSHRNDPPTNRAICYDTARRVYAIAEAVDKLIATDPDAGSLERVALGSVARETEILQRGNVAGRPKVILSPDASVTIYKGKAEVSVSADLFTLISAAVAPANESKAA